MNEQFLIRGLQNKDQKIFDFIFHYYYSGLCVFAQRFVGSSHYAEDIVQDLFVQLWNDAEALKIQSLRNYLFTCVRNRCLDVKRRDKLEAKYQKEMVHFFQQEEATNFNRFVERELEEAVLKAMEKLPPRCREIFYLSRFHGKSNQAIADKFNISKRTVEVQISQALRLLRHELRDYLPVSRFTTLCLLLLKILKFF